MHLKRAMRIILYIYLSTFIFFNVRVEITSMPLLDESSYVPQLLAENFSDISN